MLDRQPAKCRKPEGPGWADPYDGLMVSWCEYDNEGNATDGLCFAALAH